MSDYLLLIEDDADIRSTMADSLSYEGYSVQTAKDGLQGLEKLKETEDLPKLILLDLMMPNMDGISFRQEQLKDPRLAQIPVILLSADSRIKTKVETLEVNEILAKPVDLDRLIDVVNNYVVH